MARLAVKTPFYVPVLRWKGSEQTAVAALHSGQRAVIRPLFEIVPNSLKTGPLEWAFQLVRREMLVSWGWKYPCFVDFSQLDLTQTMTGYAVFGRSDDLPVILIGSLNTPGGPNTIGKLPRVKESGFGLRINAHELRQPNIKHTILHFLSETSVPPSCVDLIIDFGILQETTDSFSLLTRMVDDITGWRSITLLSGAFPPDLSHLEKNDVYLLPRYDWLSYCHYARAGGREAYGDYTIQHPIWEEREGKGLNFSASIRYTGIADWVIVRGESVRSDAGYSQYPANAQILTFHPEFRGEMFSDGDKYIAEMSRQTLHTGGAKEWLTAGISHHLAIVLYQLAHISEMPTSSVTEGAAVPDWPARFGRA